MTDAERIIRHFAQNAPPCRAHKKPLRLSNEGGWFIECEAGRGRNSDHGCLMNDDDDRESATPLLTRFEAQAL